MGKIFAFLTDKWLVVLMANVQRVFRIQQDGKEHKKSKGHEEGSTHAHTRAHTHTINVW